MSIESRIKQLEENFKNLAEAREQCDRANANSIDESNINIGETKDELVITQGEIEDAAITMADFMAEYYLSQFEGGEE